MKTNLSRFSHTYAVHSCWKCKDYSHTSKGGPNWSLFYLILAASMALPWWVYAIVGPQRLPRYTGFGILAGELLLFYGAGFAAGLLLIFRDIRPMKCPKCQAVLMLNGRYFIDHEKPNLEDFIVTALHVGANIALWMGVLSGKIHA